MTYNIPLEPEVDAKLRELAAEAGKPLEELLKEILQEAAAPPSPDGLLPPEEWSAAWRAWAANHPVTDHFVDDGRESIYGDRGL